jgi:hypothetical protein
VNPEGQRTRNLKGEEYMTQKHFSIFPQKRGRPKATTPISMHSRPPRSIEYIDRLYQKGDISLEHQLAAVYYRTLYFQVHAPLGIPALSSSNITNLTTRFKLVKAYFTPDEEEEWYKRKNQAWKELREALAKDPLICLNFIDDLILYKGLDDQFCKDGLSPQQFSMLKHTLRGMAQFFGLI